MFSMLHPLDEITPLVWKSGGRLDVTAVPQGGSKSQCVLGAFPASKKSLPRMQLELLHEQGSCSGEKPRLWKEESVGNADSVVLELILGNESVFSRSVWIVPGAVRG